MAVAGGSGVERGAEDPILRMDLVDVDGTPAVLYDLRFLRRDGPSPLLVASGDGGALLYRWSGILSKLEGRRGGSGRSEMVRLVPASVFRPHPSPLGPAEVNRTDYDPHAGALYGACGDESGKFLGNLNRRDGAGAAVAGERGRAGGRDAWGAGGGGHSDYLHAVRVVPHASGAGVNCVLTAGEDGKMGVWDGKEHRLIELVDLRSAIDGCPSTGSDDLGSGSGSGSTPSSSRWGPGNGSALFASTLDVDASGSWAAIGGGAEPIVTAGKKKGGVGPSGTAGVGATNAGPGGFVALWSLTARTLISAHVTQETVQDLMYHPTKNALLTLGNECVLSLLGFNGSGPQNSNSGSVRNLLVNPLLHGLSLYHGTVVCIA